MTNKNIWIFVIICLLPTLNSCEDDVAQAGSSSLSVGEDVIVCCDTLQDIQSSNILAKPAYVTPDSFLLGECRTQKYGSLVADILTQFAAPEGWTYPENSELDSVCLYIYYDSWVGDGNASMGLTAYELDGTEALCVDSTYPNNVDISRFCTKQPDKKILAEDPVLSAKTPTDSIYSSTTYSYINFLRYKLNDKYAQKLFNIRDFSSQEAFNKQFQGILLTSNYGASCALYVSTLCITIHYHYTYTEAGTTKTMTDSKVFYSNKDVKQLSHYYYKGQDDLFALLAKDTSANYILSPSNIYCKLTIPTQDIIARIEKKTQNRRGKYVNMAQLRIDVLNGDATGTKDEGWAKPSRNMLLIGEEEYEEVFRKGKILSDSTVVYSTLLSEYDTASTQYNYYYQFNLSTAFTQMLHNQLHKDTIQLVLVPVDLGYAVSSSSTYVASIHLKQSVSATVIRSSRDLLNPMDVEVIYSGFSSSHIGK